jgi:hypothetical protein
MRFSIEIKKPLDQVIDSCYYNKAVELETAKMKSSCSLKNDLKSI